MNTVAKKSDIDATAAIRTDFGGTANIDMNDKASMLSALENAKVIPIRQNIETWTPENINESIEGLFRGIMTIPMPSLTEQGKTENVECAVFLCKSPVPDKDTGEIAGYEIIQQSTAAKRAVSYFKTQPLNSMWRLVFKGKQKNKTNSKESSVFDFYRMNLAQIAN